MHIVGKSRDLSFEEMRGKCNIGNDEAEDGHGWGQMATHKDDYVSFNPRPPLQPPPPTITNPIIPPPEISILNPSTKPNLDLATSPVTHTSSEMVPDAVTLVQEPKMGHGEISEIVKKAIRKYNSSTGSVLIAGLLVGDGRGSPWTDD